MHVSVFRLFLIDSEWECEDKPVFTFNQDILMKILKEDGEPGIFV